MLEKFKMGGGGKIVLVWQSLIKMFTKDTATRNILTFV